MTFGEMRRFTQEFHDIMHTGSDNHKTIRLSALMTGLENYYGIPMRRNNAFEKKNPFLMQFYRMVSNARSI